MVVVMDWGGRDGAFNALDSESNDSYPSSHPSDSIRATHYLTPVHRPAHRTQRPRDRRRATMGPNDKAPIRAGDGRGGERQSLLVPAGREEREAGKQPPQPQQQAQRRGRRRRRPGAGGLVADGLLDEPLPEKVVWAYAAGHVLNDASAACWFSYLLIYREWGFSCVVILIVRGDCTCTRNKPHPTPPPTAYHMIHHSGEDPPPDGTARGRGHVQRPSLRRPGHAHRGAAGGRHAGNRLGC